MQRLKVILAHGPFFRMISKILGITESQVITTEFTYTGREILAAQDHFPGNLICPAIFLIEAMAQSAGQIAVRRKELRGLLPSLSGIERFRVRRPIRPGAVLRIESEIVRLRSTAGKAECKIYDDDQEVADMKFTFTLTKTQ
ncbi:TPA: hypothetical protein DD449_04420 [Candidatus Berkelbacteria bacterium]|uniref:Putative beta-hydroxyacyl-(Acyl-carrier-protein) dehydratase FabZ, 3R-hydroxymyristoyl ACP dehydrase n=1 Tax=Berkelbacteria bacterium GW2011_GWE1_39_12 TaxID=1618337 RepID=A0A0G4B393_9BACT|nr:MAG: putative beta-hydroxyacyl-(Acyl-carrier-protein) dehydratase FabZ, 3R-hydroxymyristoyl ACP dehydrase [Berkelbacteria bacterium GW2011_GWE1_39_12]HBO60900.1 hypothetical protein [Candidatus Berkelbacteria bacterium]